MTNYVWKEGEDPETNYRSFMNGKQATFNLATNPKNYVVNNGQESINDESLCVLSILYFTAK